MSGSIFTGTPPSEPSVPYESPDKLSVHNGIIVFFLFEFE